MVVHSVHPSVSIGGSRGFRRSRRASPICTIFIAVGFLFSAPSSGSDLVSPTAVDWPIYPAPREVSLEGVRLESCKAQTLRSCKSVEELLKVLLVNQERLYGNDD